MGVDDVTDDERVVVGLESMQLPKAGSQPVPQCALDEPHQPYCEQQSPKELFKQVYFCVPPQEPSGETLAACASDSRLTVTPKMAFIWTVIGREAGQQFSRKQVAIRT
jgi:hypothetical protein